MKKHIEITQEEIFDIYKKLLRNNVIVEAFKHNGAVEFRILKSEENKVIELLEEHFKQFDIYKEDITKVSIIGYSIIQDNRILKKVIKILEDNKIKLFDVNLTQSKIEILVGEIDNSVIEELHDNLIKEEI